MEINKIHYVIHPLWNLDLNREGVFKLVDNLLHIIDAEGKLDDRLVIANMNDLSHYFHHWTGSDFDESEQGMSFKEAKQRVQEDYARLNPLIIDAVSGCKNHFVGRPSYEESVPSGLERPRKVYIERFTPEFKSYLQDRGITFRDGTSNQDGNLILGHGSDWDACVPGACGGLVEAIKTELGKEVGFDVNEKTTL